MRVLAAMSGGVDSAVAAARAVDAGHDVVATGHYALLRTDAEGRRELHRASDEAKDQSYVLGVLTGDQLAHAMFPLGETPSKAVVRAEAAERGFRVAAKPDSHDICFIPDGDTRGWLADRVGAAPGPVVDRTGAEVGRHDGAHAYTVGQRRGLSLTRPAPDGRPRFVLEVKPASNTVVVGPKEALAVGALAGARMSWAGERPVADRFRCSVQVRAHADPVPAVAAFEGDELVVRPDEPILGLAPGQSAVLYDGTRVLGQLTVDRTEPVAAAA